MEWYCQETFALIFFFFWSWSRNIMSKFVLPLWPTFMESVNGHESWGQAYSMFYIRRKNSVKTTTIFMLFCNLYPLPPFKKNLHINITFFWRQNVAKALHWLFPFPFQEIFTAGFGDLQIRFIVKPIISWYDKSE